MKQNYITIAQYAEIKHISKQRVYQKLETNLKPFVKEVKGRKMLSVKALTDTEQKELEQAIEQNLNKFEQDLNKGENEEKTEQTALQIALDEITLLKQQLGIKDKQIETLSELANHAQMLHAGEIKKALPEVTAEETEPAPERKGFWKRIFGE